MRKKQGLLSSIILTCLFLVGLSVMLYPTISDWWNSKVQSRAIASYSETITQIDDNDYSDILELAHAYNRRLLTVDTPFVNYDDIGGYWNALDISGTGIMGYITIPQINVELPIYHGTSESVLNIAVGHIEGTSLPVGGVNTHCVLSAHRGLPSARLFTDIDQLVVGDAFTITILDEVLTYEVEEILIVLPHEVEKLAVVPNQDYVTLMTCTPYGVNTHRLLLRSRRVDTVYEQERTIRVSADAVQMDSLLVVPLIAAPMVLVLLVFWTITGRRKKRTLPYHNPMYYLPSKKGED